jgi:hypothetical protein
MENIFDFLVYICAIIGGLFTVASIIDSMIHKSVSLVFKERIKKLHWLTNYFILNFILLYKMEIDKSIHGKNSIHFGKKIAICNEWPDYLIKN